MTSLKSKTISGLFWSFSETGINQAVHFVIGIILARLLSPDEFGLIGMITIFIAVSQSFIDSGFSQALIRKTDCQQKDYATVFYFNLFVGFLFYIILFFSAGSISRFFNEPILRDLVRVLGLVLIINAFTIIQRTILIKNINFKLQTKITLASSVLSGIIGIILAYKGFGVWSLAIQQILNQLFITIFLWIFNRWLPTLEFSKQSFKEMFSFGSKLLASGLIDTTYQNIYYLIIGKFFSATELGYYTRADQFSKLPSRNITSSTDRVTYPVLSQLQNEPSKLKTGYKKIIKSLMLINFSVMLGMAAIARPMVLTLIGEKWLPSVPYLQLLCVVSMMYPLHSLNLNILKVKGRSDLFLRLEIIKKTLAIPVILIGIFIGIKAMIIGMIFNSFFAYFINSYYSSKLIDYSMSEQIKDILPDFGISISMAIIVFFTQLTISLSPLLKLIIGIVLGFMLVIGLSRIFAIDGYKELKNVIMDLIWKKKVTAQA